MISGSAGEIRPQNWPRCRMKITDFLTPDRVILDLRVLDKRRLLDDLARRSAVAAGVDAAVIFNALTAREQLGSTGMGAGIAIPHGRFSSLRQPVGFFARLRSPIDFEAIDDRRVDLVFLLLLPAEAQGEHLNALACVARRLRTARVTDALRKARDVESLHAILAAAGSGQASDTIPLARSS